MPLARVGGRRLLKRASKAAWAGPSALLDAIALRLRRRSVRSSWRVCLRPFEGGVTVGASVAPGLRQLSARIRPASKSPD